MKPAAQQRSPRRGAAGRTAVVALLVAALGLACGADPRSPEAEIRDAIERVTEAAEAGDSAAVRDFISERYQDERGNDRRTLGAYVAGQVMRRERRHLLTRVRRVDLREKDRASVLVVIGMAARPLAEADDPGLRADVYRVDLELEDEGSGDWKVVWADWHPARVTDLL
jgi:hypothetical protein